MELLSPAGNLQAAYAAFKGGADAIYIGGKQFSARASANNFSNDEIKEIVFFAHSIGKKVYVTVNTLLFQDEFFLAVEFCQFLYTINIDGVIIQDLGLAHYLHETLPELPLNASTQLNCHNLKQAKALIKIGFKRIVMARETDLALAREVKKLGVEVEVFGHGALCVSYSGNCLLSSFIGDRSGNRGRCAQPCRMPYDLLEDGKAIEEKSFVISTKDLMTLDFINKYIEAGIDSIKIEGRLKSDEYIYIVSKAYRHAIDAVNENRSNTNSSIDKENLIKIFNRQFTKGFVLGENQFSLLNQQTSSHQGQTIGKVVKAYKNRVAIQVNKKVHRLDGIRFNSAEQFGLTIEKMFANREPVEEVNANQVFEISGIENAERLMGLEVIRTKDYLVTKQIEEEIKKQIKVNCNATFFAKANAPIALTISFNDVSVTVKGETAQVAEGNGTAKERIIEQLSKSGDYPYSINNLDVKMDKCFIPISKINELRNKAFQELQNKLIVTNELHIKEYKNTEICKENTCKTNFIVENQYQSDVVTDAGFFAFSNKNEIYRNNNRITSNDKFDKPFEILHFVIEKEADNYLIASQYCSITNSYALDCFYELGFDQCILSLELDYESTIAMIEDYKNRHGNIPNVGFVVYGKQDMMIMRSCPVGVHYKNKAIHCERCHHKKFELVDRIGEKYRVVGDSECNTRILNNHPIFLLDRIFELKKLGISNIWFVLTDEHEEKVDELITHLENNDAEFNRFNYTRGHYNKRPL